MCFSMHLVLVCSLFLSIYAWIIYLRMLKYTMRSMTMNTFLIQPTPYILHTTQSSILSIHTQAANWSILQIWLCLYIENLENPVPCCSYWSLCEVPLVTVFLPSQGVVGLKLACSYAPLDVQFFIIFPSINWSLAISLHPNIIMPIKDLIYIHAYT